MKDNVEMVYMWRELNDEWYRIQTNSPYIIGKLNRRSKKKNKIRLVGKTVKSSSQYWLIECLLILFDRYLSDRH